ncbi:MAG: hypothetical protein QOE31_493 [Solirubrobacteraceae bacterium]|jgi:hypothetical protein|nr:hypothetical protein [Solirubrobacteraceae bacterium]
MTSNNEILGVVLGGWIEGLRLRDLGLVERHLHPDAVWQGVRENLVCRGRDDVLENLAQAQGRLPDVHGLELSAHGDQVLLGVRSPDLTEVAGETLHEAIYNVFTIADGLIARIDDFRTRDEAIAAMRSPRDG